MYAFEGNYRRTPQQNLAGASRIEGKNELINRVHYERKKRQEQRIKEESAVHIQRCVRGFLIRRRLKKYFTAEFDSRTALINDTPFYSSEDICYLVKRLPFLGIKNPDVPRVLITTQIVFARKELILKDLTRSKYDWIWRIKLLILYNINFLKQAAVDDLANYTISLNFVDYFTSYECISPHIDNEICSDFIIQIFLHAVDHGYFNIGFHLLKQSYDNPSTCGMDTVYAIKVIGKPLTTFKFISNEDYKLAVLKNFCKTLNGMDKEIHPSIMKVFFSEMKVLGFPYMDFVNALLNTEIKTFHSVLLYCALYFDSCDAVYDYEEYINYFKVLSILSRNLVNIEMPSKSDNESDDEEEIELCDKYTEQVILKECITLLNDPKKAEIWVSFLNTIFKNEVWDTLTDFATCLYHLIICGNFPVYHCRILLLLTHHKMYLKGFWQCISQLKRVGTFSEPVPLISIIARGTLLDKEESSKLIPLLTIFSYILKFLYALMSEEEFYAADSSENPFTLSEMVSLSKTLKDIAVGLILLAYPDTNHTEKTDQRIHMYAPSSNVVYNIKCWRSLLEEVVGLVALLNARDSRKSFTKEGHWLSSFISIPDNITLFDGTRTALCHPFTRFPFRVHARIKFQKESENIVVLTVYESRTVYLLTSIPFTIAFIKRFSVLQNYFDMDRADHQHPQMHYLHSPHYFVRIRRQYLYEDAFEKLSGENAPDLKITVKIQMINRLGLDEAGVDGGGVFREFMVELLKTAFDPNRGFFIYNNDNELYPNPNVHILIPEFEQHYYFIGRILGKAIYEGILVEIPLTDFFLAKLTGNTRNLYLHNLASLDPDLYKNIINLRKFKGDFSELGLDFTISSSEYGRTITHELKPNGSEIQVNAENVIEYIDLVAKFKMENEISRQTTAFKQGIQDVFSLDWLRMFSPRELQVIISGDKAPIDITDMKLNTVYAGGFSADHPCIVMFWKVMDSFSNHERSLFLRFVTSCSRPPLLGFKDLHPPICIQYVEGSVNDRFPTSSTCMNLLKLPAFSDESTLRSKLLYAIESGAGFELS